MTRLLARLATLFTALLAGAAAAQCPPAGGLPPVAATASGPAEMRLPDGRAVRLAGLHVPEAVGPDARRLLEARLAAGPVVVAPLREAPDRYGRVAARVTVGGGWLEAELLRAGLALVSLFPGEESCATELLAAEREGRRARAGLWTSAPGPVLHAEDRERLTAGAGRFVLVAGTVASVGSRDYATFLNFGRRWTEAAALVIRRADRARIEAAHGPLDGLRGRRLLVRGVIEPGAAPRLTITAPESIEVLD